MLTENEPFPAGFLEGTAELTVSYSAGKGFALNGKEFTSLYEGAFEVLPGNAYIALHVFTGSRSGCGGGDHLRDRERSESRPRKLDQLRGRGGRHYIRQRKIERRESRGRDRSFPPRSPTTISPLR